jgi:hypothetical protein
MWRSGLVLMVACGGATPHESARYDTDLDSVLTAVTDVAKQNAKQVVTDRDHEAVHTAWQVVAVTHEETASPYAISKIDHGGTVRYFARYDIQIVGARPWQVAVAAHASRWVDGETKARQLSDDNPPAWLVEHRNHIIDDINARLRTSAIAPR